MVGWLHRWQYVFLRFISPYGIGFLVGLPNSGSAGATRGSPGANEPQRARMRTALQIARRSVVRNMSTKSEGRFRFSSDQL